MPRVDGFELCLQVRRSTDLARVPVVLVSSHYVEAADQALARRVGANALVLRTPGCEAVIEALLGGLDAGGPLPDEPVEILKTEHTQRLLVQLERQLRANVHLAQSSAVQAAQLAFYRRLATMGGEGAAHTMREALACCLDAAGLSRAAIHLSDGEKLVLQHAVGFEPDAEPASLFGHAELLDQVVGSRSALAFPSAGHAAAATARVLRASGCNAALLLPLVNDGRCLGTLFLGSSGNEIVGAEALALAEGLATRVGEAVATVEAHVRASAARQRYAALVENANDAVAVLSAEGTILEVNRRWEETLLLPRERIVGRHIREFAPPGRESENARAYGESIDAGGRRAAVEIARADGSILTMEFANAALDVGGERLVLAIGRDVTEQVRMRAQLAAADRMASIGMIAASVAHEIKNPLACVAANLELAVQATGELPDVPAAMREELADELRDACEGARRVQQIVRDLGVFSRPADERSAPVDVRAVLEASLRLARTELVHRALLVKELGEVPLVQGNECRLGQVFLNLLVNAAQAIPDDLPSKKQIRVVTRTDADGSVVVEVADTGTGMPPEVVDRLFTPFFTTKPPGAGTGLGLSICHRIVTSMGGEIAVESEVGKGTRFIVRLPAMASGPPRALPDL